MITNISISSLKIAVFDRVCTKCSSKSLGENLYSGRAGVGEVAIAVLRKDVQSVQTSREGESCLELVSE
jgi:hypothetical protein